ncbi:MAG: N-glycosylase/DNA lyase [archaeon]
MEELICRVENLKANDISSQISERLQEFKSLGKKSSNEIFKELCFCILTANYTAEGGIRIQKEIGDGFLKLSEKQLAKKLKELGHRFPNTRANYIVNARKLKDNLVLERDWLVQNVKGLGMKEASHFLRNIGYENYAIIDFHILDLLAVHGIIEKPKSLSRTRYLEIEAQLKQLADTLGMNLAELDMYLWFCETGTVLK